MAYAPDDLPENGPVILAIGKKSKGKGTDVLLAAMPLVRERVPDAILVLLGKHSEYVTRQESWLWNVDSVPSEDVPLWIDAARVVCHPSYAEGFPRAVLDAMAQGRACVATRALGGVAELIVDGVTGYLVARGDHVDLAEALITALDRERAIRLGVAGFKRMASGALMEQMHAFNRAHETMPAARASWSAGDFMLLPLLVLTVVALSPVLVWDWITGRR